MKEVNRFDPCFLAVLGVALNAAASAEGQTRYLG